MFNILENHNSLRQSRIINVFCFAMFFEIHTFFANAIGRLLLGNSPLDTALVYGILAFLFLEASLDILKKINFSFILGCAFLFLFMTASIIINWKLRQYSDVIKSAYIAVFVGLLLGGAVTDFGLLEEKLCKLSTVLAVEMIISFFIYHFVFDTEWGTGAMGLSYKLLVPAVLLLYRIFKKFDVKYLILFLVLVAIMILQGSRGPLVSLVCFAVIYQLINASENRIRLLRNMAILLVLAILFVVYLSDILEWVAYMCDKFGFQSKFLRVMSEGNFFLANGRDTVAENIKSIIISNPLGNGFFAERPVIGTYCHNIFLEFILDFGVFFGTIFVILYVVLIIKKFRSADFAERNVINILFCAFLIKLFFSGSFWTETMFFAFLSFIIRPNYKVQLQEVTLKNETCADC